MPTVVGILSFISMINTTSESLKSKKVFIFHHFSLYEQFTFHAQYIKKNSLENTMRVDIQCIGNSFDPEQLDLSEADQNLH